MDQKTPANSPFAIARIQSGILTREKKMLCVVGCAEMRKVDYESEDNKGDLHEWMNEGSTVPTANPLNLLSLCRGKGLPSGSEDPMELYCSLSLNYGITCAA
jgi:hypothetical protein